ncbi:hypothetical protein JXL19_06320 [bacterium]|nr:hypothetical protein [bacterium]
MIHLRSTKTAYIILSVIAIVLFFVPRALAEDHSYIINSSSHDGELKSKGADYGQFKTGDKGFNSGAVGGGNRGYEYVVNPDSKAPSKKGARGAIDGEPDIGGSSKGNTFTTTSLQESIRIGQALSGNYEIFKGFLSFDTTAIPYDASIKFATLTFYGKSKLIKDGGEDFDIQVYNSIWTEPLWNPDWGTITGNIRGSLNTSDFKVAQTNTITIDRLNANYLVKKGDITKIALVSSKTIEQEMPVGTEYIEIYSSNAANKDFRPELKIDYDGSAPNVKPSLSWSGEAYYKLSGVYPEEIWIGENILTFKVQYAHPLNIPPQISQIWIDINHDGDFNDPGERVDMRAEDIADTDYSNGKNYFAQVTINSDGVNDLEYRFMFSDGTGVEATGTPTQVASIAAIQTEEKNTCFINTAGRRKSFSSVMNFFTREPMIYFIFSSIADKKLTFSINF